MSEEKKRTISEQADDIRKELDELIGTDESITDLVEKDPVLPPARIKENVSFKDMKANHNERLNCDCYLSNNNN